VFAEEGGDDGVIFLTEISRDGTRSLVGRCEEKSIPRISTEGIECIAMHLLSLYGRLILRHTHCLSTAMGGNRSIKLSTGVVYENTAV
jgi:hypothetical protein